jgi:uncharacterized protein YlzI (FlbEa/FlbD family)
MTAPTTPPAPDIKATYAKLQKAYKLPKWEEMAEFEIDMIESEKHLVKEVAKKVYERMDLFKKILESLLQPDVSITAMQEAERLTDEEHLRITELVRDLMRLDRLLLAAELENNETAYAVYIIDATARWKAMKPTLAPIVRSLRAGWEKSGAKKQQHHYMG